MIDEMMTDDSEHWSAVLSKNSILFVICAISCECDENRNDLKQSSNPLRNFMPMVSFLLRLSQILLLRQNNCKSSILINCSTQALDYDVLDLSSYNHFCQDMVPQMRLT